MSLTQCRHCNANVFTGDVFKQVAIPKSPQHVALSYRCGNCEEVSKFVATWEEWEDAQKSWTWKTFKRKKVADAAHIELDAIESADDLIALWQSLRHPPEREAVLGACQCPDCKKRLYG